MRNYLIIFLLLFATGTTVSGTPSIVSGKWDKKNKTAVMLFRVEHGALMEVASSQPTTDGRFFLAFEVEQEGFYVVGQNVGIGVHNYTVYFKPGDNLDITVNEDNSYTLSEANTPENKELERWSKIVAPLVSKAVYYVGQNSTYVDFFPLLDEKLVEIAAYKPAYTKNKTFTEAFKALREYDIMFYALHFLLVPRSAHPQGEDFPDYYRNLSIADFTASQWLMRYPYGRNILSGYPYAFIALTDTMTEEEKVTARHPKRMYDCIINQTSNDAVKGEAALLSARYIKTYEEYLAFEAERGKLMVTDNQKLRMKEMMLKAADNAKGQTAVDFRFPDLSGKEVALSDFKGKVVYIDVWATWCVPCRKEIPEMKRLEEEYHGKDIVFMSVSTDAQKDYEKWKTFIAENEMKGVQLFAGDRRNEIGTPYRITGIPRFILVDKEGKLIAADAPRPSAPEIRTVLNAALGK